MFKESKHINNCVDKIKNNIELNKIIENSRVDRTETCFSGKSRLTEKEYLAFFIIFTYLKYYL